MPTISNVKLFLTPIDNSGLPIAVLSNQPISGERRVRVSVKATFVFKDEEVGEKFNVEVRLRGKDNGESVDLYSFHFYKKFVYDGHQMYQYRPYQEIIPTTKSYSFECQATIEAKTLDEDPGPIFKFKFDSSGGHFEPVGPAPDQIIAYVTLQHVKFSGLSDQEESLEETILVQTYN